MPCTTILAGKKATNDGSTIIARNNDGSFRQKQVLITQPDKQPRVYKTVISHLTVELPEEPLRYSCTPNFKQTNGRWPVCGINELNVAMTATETVTTNPRVMGADPYVEYIEKKSKQKEVPGGIGEEDLLTLVLPYIHSAKEGVLRLGALLEKYGTYEANGIAFCDKDDVWWLETIGGHHWIAKRVPDDRVVIMPNQFGLDSFDFDDAYGEQKENICSADLKEFTEKNFLYTGRDWKNFNPRHAYGSRTDTDHIYNTPRGWYMARYFLENSFDWDSPNADYTPESNDIPWSFVPERKVTIEDVRYLLTSYYQGTLYDPYDDRSVLKGKYRVIGVPNSDISGIQQIRGYLPELVQAVEWLSMGGSGFTACFPIYTNVNDFPKYISGTTDKVSTDSMYWHSRLIAALTDAHYKSGVGYSEHYQENVANKSRKILAKYDARIIAGEAESILEEANKEIIEMVKAESDKTLFDVLSNASEHMRTRYHRNDY